MNCENGNCEMQPHEKGSFFLIIILVLLILLFAGCANLSEMEWGCAALEKTNNYHTPQTYFEGAIRGYGRSDDYVEKVRFTYYHSVPEQTQGNPKITASGRHVDGFSYDTLYIAVPQNKYQALKKYSYCFIGSMPCLVVDKFARKHNGKPKIDVWRPNGQKFPIDSGIIVFTNYQF